MRDLAGGLKRGEATACPCSGENKRMCQLLVLNLILGLGQAVRHKIVTAT